MSHLKLSVLSFCGVLLLAQYGLAAQNLVANPGFEDPNTNGNLVCEKWTRTSSNGAATIQVNRLAGGGEAGSASLNLTTIGGAGASSSSNGAWQIIPVTAGKTYQIRGRWRGKLMPQAVAGANATVEFYAGFGNSSTTRASSANETLIYRKRLNYNNDPVVVNLNNTMNVDPNTGTWDWENIQSSINLGWAGGDRVTATDSYMTIRVLMNTSTQSGDEFVDLDNIQVIACSGAVGNADINDDCALDFQDVAYVANNWLVCGVSPQNLCW